MQSACNHNWTRIDRFKICKQFGSSVLLTRNIFDSLPTFVAAQCKNSLLWIGVDTVWRAKAVRNLYLRKRCRTKDATEEFKRTKAKVLTLKWLSKCNNIKTNVTELNNRDPFQSCSRVSFRRHEMQLHTGQDKKKQNASNCYFWNIYLCINVFSVCNVYLPLQYSCIVAKWSYPLFWIFFPRLQWRRILSSSILAIIYQHKRLVFGDFLALSASSRLLKWWLE